MGDLHSIAYLGSQSRNSSLCWDFHNLEVLNADIFSHCHANGTAAMEMNTNSTPPFYDHSTFDSDLSSGYLQDALFEFSSKRRRLLLLPDDDDQHQLMITNQNSSPSFESYWNSNSTHDFDYSLENFCQFDSGDTIFSGQKSGEGETDSANNTAENSTSSSQSKSSITIKSFSDKETLSSSDKESEEKKKVITRVVYPFALVKPGGFKGDMTLNDINERILMPPTRPVKHPVGDYACRPLVSPDGPGLSGKAVVALTRIQTQGRGTITIIRTKG